MEPRLLLLIILISPFVARAQNALSTSRHTSPYTYIYQITPSETWELTKSNMKKCSEKFLHTLVDSFLTDNSSAPALSTGNYLLVCANANRLRTTLKTVGDLKFQLLNNQHNFAIALFNKQAQPIKDAKVFIGHKSIPYHNTTQSYKRTIKKRGGYIKIYHNSILYVFPVANNKVPKQKPYRQHYYSYFESETAYQKNFRGFMAFSKPMYKPGDTFKLKAFILTKTGKPVNRPVLVRLTNRNFDTDTILAVIKPYRPGGYEYSFVLNDSLDIDLGEKYLVTLEELSSRKFDYDEYDGKLDEEEYAAKRKVLRSEKFDYEEYELGKITFTAKTDKHQHHRGNPAALLLKATDENELPIADGRVEIIVTPNQTIRQFYDSSVFIPDTLWKHNQVLDPVGETKIIIPDSIFPAADLSYEIRCTFLNSDNEEHNEHLFQKFKNSDAEIIFETLNDSLHIYGERSGQPMPVAADITAYDKEDDTSVHLSAQLPVTIPIHPFAATYEVETEKDAETYTIDKQPRLVTCLASRTKDSIIISVQNPGKLFFWYTIHAGKRIVQSGYADTLLYSAKTTTPNYYYATLRYIHADKMQIEDYTIPFNNKLLSIEVDQPTRVYPGQVTDINVTVKDATGNPVPDADVTAFAITKKFNGYRPPYVPDFSRRFRLMKYRASFYAAGKPILNTALKLAWQRWSKEMGLDSIEYFKFLYPERIYTNYEASHEQLTQIAPFVVLHGELQPIHQLYIDEEPVFFSQAQDLQQYSFSVKPGMHSLRLRTAKHMVTVDSIWAYAGNKTFVSINADTTMNKLAHVLKMPDTLTKYEKGLWSRYMILVENNWDKGLAYIKNNDRYHVLPQTESEQFLAGPFFHDNSVFGIKNRFTQHFEAEGNYMYDISQGLIRQKQLPFGNYAFQSKLTTAPVPRFSDFVLTKKDIDSLWNDYLDNRAADEDLFRNKETSSFGNGRLQIAIRFDSTVADLSVRKIMLFRYDNPDFIRIYKGKTRDFGYMRPGRYRMLVLLKDEKYVIKDDMLVRKDGLNYYSTIIKDVQLKDTMSVKITAIIDNNYIDAVAAEQIKERFNAEHFSRNMLTQTISGQVISNKQSTPLAGAVIKIKGTAFSAVTNLQGMFTIQVPVEGVLQVSYIGYDTREVILGNQHFYNIEMHERTVSLDEVVVVGYGTTARRRNTGTVATIRNLQGRVPGLLIPKNAPANDELSIEEPIDALEQGNTLRKNFRDDAFWQPRLTTNALGKASFTVTYPDDITNWRTFFYAMASKKQTGSVEQSVRSFKILSANLAYPQFAVAGDTINIIAKSLSYTADTVVVNRTFMVDSNTVNERSLAFQHAYIDTFSVVAKQVDSLRLTYTIQKPDGYFDGEERVIPVFKPGTLETHGYFAALDRDTTVSVSFPFKAGAVQIFAEANLLPVLLNEIDQLRDYEYLCNEQLASKLKALLLKKKVFSYQKKEFREERNIRQIIDLLEQNKASATTWGWWKGTHPSMWISLHVAEALLSASQQGYTIRLNKQMLSDYWMYHLERDISVDTLLVLKILQLAESKANLEPYIDSLEKRIKNATPLIDVLRLMEVKQLAGQPVRPDSLLKKQKHTAFGNLYWGEDGYRFFDNTIHNTILMYRILKRAGGYDAVLRKIRNYFLEQRKSGKWRNTYESSLIMETILPDVLNEQGSDISSISVNGEAPVTVFPYSKEITNTTNLTIAKSGKFPVYFTAYQKSWNPDPVKVSGNFEVNSSFTKQILKAGEPTKLNVQVAVKADADYVMIEIPIPAGCSYRDKMQPWSNNEVHREYFKNKVSIFCSGLTKGTYTFSVDLMPRFTGRYHLNPARAEMMYFTVFNGQEAMKKVIIQ